MNQKNLLAIALLLSLCCSTFISAQTSSAGVRATPSPTRRTEAETSNLPQNPEALDETIKQPITEYFEWLNRADKEGALRASSMKPITTLREAQAFLAAKTDVLEVVEYSNQLNGVKIENQSLELSFRGYSFSNNRKTVEVDVVERYERKYEYFVEPTAGEIVHTIKLKYQTGQWQVVDDTLQNANDAAPKRVDKAALQERIREEAALRRSTEQQLLLSAGVTESFLSAERERLAKLGLDPRTIEEQLTVLVNEKMNGGGKPDGKTDTITPLMLVNRGYNRAAAKTYIDTWWYRRNPSWGNFDTMGGDCTNWVSQIINAGGVPEDKTGSYQWYWDNMNAPRTSSPYTRSASWSGVNELWNYIQGNSNNNGPNGPQGQWWTSSSGLTQMATGDFIQLSSGASWFHTYGVYDGQWVNLKPWYCPWCSDDWRYKVRVTSHTQDRWRDDLDSVAATYTKRYVHITGWYQP